jgi:hypothetical protein
MLRPYLLPALLLLAGTTALEAQADYYARVGAIGATMLSRDAIASEIEVRQSIAPMVALGASLPIAPRYRAGVEATLSSGGYHAEENGAETDLGTLRTASLLLGLEGPVATVLRWRAGMGGLLYWPSDDAGIFLQGNEARFLAGAGLDYRRAVLPAWDLMASVRYDYHRFISGEQERRGFAQAQAVSRVSLSVGLARGLR